MVLMDAIDRQILDLLQDNGRTTVLEIARKVKLSSPSVSERLKKLHRRGYIKKYVAILDEKKLGKTTTAFVRVSIQYPKYFPLFISRINELPEVMECHRITGDHSCILKVRVKDTEALDHFLTRKVGEIEGVTNATSEIVLSTMKEETRLTL
ncbi:MAG: Lrp/AsnC family transcriptional regulator [Deltaproteobacteria bacterium]|nr:Lrp/AsnC family transcriptional regulator [Deltaproteobacteria bacterium]